MGEHSLPTYSTSSHLSPPALSLEEATDFVIKRARELVEELVRRRGRQEPPFLSEEYAPLQGIKETVKTNLGEPSAVLIRSIGGHIIKVNANHHPVRQNFSCAHEIGHTLLDELEQETIKGRTEFRGLSPDIGRKAKERLCEAAAAELLMPERVFREHLSRVGLSVSSIQRLARTFHVSIPATAIRIAEVSLEPCIAILWQPWSTRKSRRLRIRWCTGPGRRSPQRERYTPAQEYVTHRESSSLVKAYEGDCPVKSFRLFKLGNISKRCYTESQGFGHGKTRYVMSLAFPGR